MKVLILSTSLLTNRLLSQSFFQELNKSAEITVWAKSDLPFLASGSSVFKDFPQVKNNREWVNFFRGINERAWSEKLKLTSILSMQRFSERTKPITVKKRIQHTIGKLIASFHLETMTEVFIKTIVRTQDRGVEARKELTALKPDLVLVTNPFWMHESSIAIEAKKLGIKIFSIVPSWDNLTTKSRLTFNSDMYFVWSEIRTKELLAIYPQSRDVPIYEYGTPQYECFYQSGLHLSREEFCEDLGLNPNKKIVLYATGSPNFLKTEYQGAETFAQIFKSEQSFDNCQLLIRPHPNKDNNELQYLHRPEDHVFVQFTENAELEVVERSMGVAGIKAWLNTFLHCDVVINLSSTVTLDALAFDKPVININFDPDEKGVFEEFIKEINGTWHHLTTINNCREIPQANSFEELKDLCIQLLENPRWGLDQRKKLFQSICGNPKEPLGEKMAKVILSEFSKL